MLVVVWGDRSDLLTMSAFSVSIVGMFPLEIVRSFIIDQQEVVGSNPNDVVIFQDSDAVKLGLGASSPNA